MKIVPVNQQNIEEACQCVDSVFSYLRKSKPSETFRAGVDRDLFATYRQEYDIVSIMHWVAIDADTGQVIGTTGLYEFPEDQEEAFWLGWFCVSPAARGKGVGRKLLEFSISLARLLGKRVLRLYTSAHRKELHAQALYKQQDFEVVVSKRKLPGKSLIFREKIINPSAARQPETAAATSPSQQTEPNEQNSYWKSRQDFIRGLKKLSIDDQPLFNEYLKTSGNKSWISFFPFLLSLAERKGRTLYWETIRDSMCLYFFSGKAARTRMSLFLPPFPFNDDVLAATVLKVAGYNNNTSIRINWVEGKDKDSLEQLGYSLRPVGQEYLYSAKQLHALHHKIRVTSKVLIRSYRPEDEAACLELLQKWRANIQQTNTRYTGFYYKNSCIRNAAAYVDGSVTGKVMIIDGHIQGVSFAGPISEHCMSSFFTLVAPQFRKGIPYLMTSMADQNESMYWNNSEEDDDEESPHLHDVLTPAAIHTLYRAQKRYRSID